MKLLGSVLVLWTLVGVISGATIDKRGAAVGLNVNVAAPTAYPAIPSIINQLTSGLFTPNATTGETPIYGLLKQLTSNIYPSLANTTYSLLKPLNNLINQITSNLYNGLCAPPMPNYPTGQTPTAGGGPTATPTSPATATNPITNIINFLTGNGGTSAASSGANASSSMANTILGLIVQHFSNDASTAQSLISTLSGLLNGATGTTGTTNETDPLTAILNSLGLGASSSQSGSGTGTGTGSGTGTGTGTWTGLFPGVTVTGGVNTTLNVSPQALTTVLSSIGQTLQSLQAALAKLGWGAQQFVNGLAAYGGNVLAYLQAIFTPATTPATPTTGAPGANTFQELVNTALNGLNNILGGTGLIDTVTNFLKSLLGV